MHSVGEITGLDLTLMRIGSIETNFNKLLNEKKEVTEAGAEFKEILDKTIDAETDKKTTATTKNDFEDLIEKHAAKNGLDPDFIKAIVKQESGFNPNATSKCGAMGLMQLMPATAKGLGVTDAYNPEENIMGGIKYFKSMLNKFNQDPELALAAYNAGPGAVQKYGNIPPYRETQNYVKNIMANYNNIKNSDVPKG